MQVCRIAQTLLSRRQSQHAGGMALIEKYCMYGLSSTGFETSTMCCVCFWLFCPARSVSLFPLCWLPCLGLAPDGCSFSFLALCMTIRSKYCVLLQRCDHSSLVYSRCSDQWCFVLSKNCCFVLYLYHPVAVVVVVYFPCHFSKIPIFKRHCVDLSSFCFCGLDCSPFSSALLKSLPHSQLPGW